MPSRSTVGPYLVLEADISEAAAAARLVGETLERFGRLDVVVANAAIARDVATAELSDDEWTRLLDVDLTGVFRCFRAALPPMIDAGWGRLLATSSIAGGSEGWARHAHYATAKAGIVGLVRALALEAGPYGITVNAVAPGVIETPQSLDPVNSARARRRRRVRFRVPWRRNGRPEDVAHAFAYLASEEASFVTGQTLVVDRWSDPPRWSDRAHLRADHRGRRAARRGLPLRGGLPHGRRVGPGDRPVAPGQQRPDRRGRDLRRDGRLPRQPHAASLRAGRVRAEPLPLPRRGREARSTDELRFEPVDDGTRIAYRAVLSMKGLSRLAEPFLGRTWTATGARALAGLKAKLTAPVAAAPTPPAASRDRGATTRCCGSVSAYLPVRSNSHRALTIVTPTRLPSSP
ncbi:MAG: SDR family oxidoreductase [Acidimicrobiia bacterium]|nr:SDR family oxidoreductase [Acidimicrobiia bacterium]